MLRLLDTIALLAAPFASAMYQEFGDRLDFEREHAREREANEATATTTTTAETAASAKTAVEAEKSVTGPGNSPIEHAAECDATPQVSPEVIVTSVISDDSTAPAAVADPAAPAEPLYVRRGTGKAMRYDLAGPTDRPGERWRRLTRGKRAVYEPVK